jgi:hypothetical protein
MGRILRHVVTKDLEQGTISEEVVREADDAELDEHEGVEGAPGSGTAPGQQEPPASPDAHRGGSDPRYAPRKR